MGLTLDHLRELVDGVEATTVDVRRDLHAHPELAFAEHRTTAIVRDSLEALGLEALPCPTETGAVARVRGGRPGRTVLLRADIDALPLDEEVDVAYRSRNSGVMHACGHDGHTAMLLGVASVLAARAEDLPGQYVLLFQPAEELGGGALRMVEGGVLDGLGAERMVSLHLTSLLRTGLLAMRPGIAMSAAQVIRARLTGAGGHGALAGRSGSAVLAVAELAQALPAIADGLAYRDVDCVCSTGLVHAGTAPNVVPRDALLHGTLRTFLPEQREEALGRLRRIAGVIAAGHRVRIDLDLPDPVPAVVNGEAETDVVRRACAEAVGEGAVLEVPPMTPSDDVSEFLNRVPGCHFFVGAHGAATPPPMHHAPDFAFDEAAMRVGMLAMTAAALALAG